MNKIFITNFILISFLSIFITRFIPHPPNFTSTIAIIFYLPALFGYKFLAVAFTAFIISDLIIGMHHLIFFTWGSLLIIGLLSRHLNNYYYRIFGIIFSCFLFFIITNFGFWLLSDIYSKDYEGLLTCYFMALPFLQNSLLGSLIVSIVIEVVLTLNNSKAFIKRVNTSF